MFHTSEGFLPWGPERLPLQIDWALARLPYQNMHRARRAQFFFAGVSIEIRGLNPPQNSTVSSDPSDCVYDTFPQLQGVQMPWKQVWNLTRHHWAGICGSCLCYSETWKTSTESIQHTRTMKSFQERIEKYHEALPTRSPKKENPMQLSSFLQQKENPGNQLVSAKLVRLDRKQRFVKFVRMRRDSTA